MLVEKAYGTETKTKTKWKVGAHSIVSLRLFCSWLYFSSAKDPIHQP
jgi:hypothetical protein